MEAKLKEYRAIRRRKEIINNVKEKLEKSKQKIVNFIIPETFRNMENRGYRKEEEVLLVCKIYFFFLYFLQTSPVFPLCITLTFVTQRFG